MRCIQLGSSVGCSKVPQVHFVRKQTMCKSLYTYLTICFAFEKPRWLLHNTADRAETAGSATLTKPEYFTRRNQETTTFTEVGLPVLVSTKDKYHTSCWKVHGDKNKDFM